MRCVVSEKVVIKEYLRPSELIGLDWIGLGESEGTCRDENVTITAVGQYSTLTSTQNS